MTKRCHDIAIACPVCRALRDIAPDDENEGTAYVEIRRRYRASAMSSFDPPESPEFYVVGVRDCQHTAEEIESMDSFYDAVEDALHNE